MGFDVTRFAADDVQLPQLHRRVSLPPSIRRSRPASRPAIDQALAEQHPVDHRPGRHRPPSNSELELQPARFPPRMRPPLKPRLGLLDTGGPTVFGPLHTLSVQKN
jgi:hypothetical protein